MSKDKSIDDRVCLSILDIVAMSGCSHETIYKHIREGKLPARKMGRRTFVLRSDFEEFLNNCPRLEIGAGETR